MDSGECVIYDYELESGPFKNSQFNILHVAKKKGCPVIGFAFLKLDPDYSYCKDRNIEEMSTVIKWRIK